MPKKVDAVTEEEFLAQGGSQVTIDLSHLLKDRIHAAISSVMQLTDGGIESVVLHTTALATVMTRYYTYLCMREGHVIPKEEFLDMIVKGMDPLVDSLMKAMHRELNQGSHFENLLKQLRNIKG